MLGGFDCVLLLYDLNLYNIDNFFDLVLSRGRYFILGCRSTEVVTYLRLLVNSFSMMVRMYLRRSFIFFLISDTKDFRRIRIMVGDYSGKYFLLLYLVERVLVFTFLGFVLKLFALNFHFFSFFFSLQVPLFDLHVFLLLCGTGVFQPRSFEPDRYCPTSL